MRIADVIYNQVALKKNRLLYGDIMKKSCDNCKFEEYSWKEQVCVSCERHGMVQYKDNWQPKPTDKPDSQLTDTDGTDCIKQMTSDEAFEKWFDKAWGTAEMGISKHAALQDAFTAGFKAGALSERKVVIDKIVRWASKKKDGEAFILSGRGAKTEDMDLEVLDYPHHYCIDAMDDLIKYLNDQTKEEGE